LKKYLLLALKITISLGLLGYLLSQLDWPALIDKAVGLAWWTIPLAVFVLLLTLYIGTLRWAVLLRTHYTTFNTPLLFRHYLVATLFNNILPTATGGDLIRSYYIYRHNRDTVCAVSPIVTERVIGLVVLLAINVAAIYLTDSVDIVSKALWSTLTLILTGAIATLTLIALPATYWPIHKLLERLARFRIIGFILRMGEATHGYLKHPATLLKIISYSAAAQLFAVLVYYILAIGLGVDISIQVILVVIPLAFMAAALPISIGGMGVRELATVGLLMRFGIVESDAAAIALMYIPVLLLASLPGLYIYLSQSSNRTLLKEAEESRIN
jgi:uncharacterized protein (TIRG00374 family)